MLKVNCERERETERKSGKQEEKRGERKRPNVLFVSETGNRIPKYPRKAILAVLLTEPKPSTSGNLSRNSV